MSVGFIPTFSARQQDAARPLASVANAHRGVLLVCVGLSWALSIKQFNMFGAILKSHFWFNGYYLAVWLASFDASACALQQIPCFEL
jgi:hypothetical protein